ncbi:HlyD family efflux transporter periplasmic adaptor subunit [Alcanivorax sp. IO_7]|nr:HlyD family efflux transporter periplasmic adaptor subunit [Alcanivorax sp. IO_7]
MIAESELDELLSRYHQARAAFKLARDNLSYTRLLAPYNGVVASTEQENHQFVQAQEPVMNLQSSATIDVRFSVSQSFISRMAPLDRTFRAEVIFPALPEQRFPPSTVSMRLAPVPPRPTPWSSPCPPRGTGGTAWHERGSPG